MFKSARIKLTFWYLLIISVISISFSAGIYGVLVSELDRVERMQRSRVEHVIVDRPPRPPYIDPEIIAETKDRIGTFLFIINITILASTTVAGYFLAGKTLKPIEEMVDEQKRFVSDASHELRTPLTSLKTEIEVALRNRNLDLSMSKNLLRSNLEEVDRMNKLSNCLLTLNRYCDDNGQIEFKSVGLKKVVAKAVAEIAPLAKKKNILIAIKPHPVFVRGNEESLVELTKILLDNAVKYTGENGKVSVIIVKEDKKAYLRVRDNGIGIKSSDIELIFKRFYRSDLSRTKNKIDGYGLGLSIAQNIVNIHKGKISVKSVFDKGTTFTVGFSALSQERALE